MRRLSRVVATVTAVATIGLSAACGGDNPTPSAAPSTSPSPTESSPADAGQPSRSKATTRRTRGGAEAAVRYFIESLNYSGATGDTAPLRMSYAASCTRCEAIADSIAKTYGAGGGYEGGQWTPSSVKFYRIQGNVAVFDAVVDYSAQNWTPAKGSAPKRFKASEGNLHSFQLRYGRDAGWLVGALDPES